MLERVVFKGPFSWHSSARLPNVLTGPYSKDKGLYIWTVPQSIGEMIYYVGETGRSFAQRMFEHLKEHLAGFYHLYEPIQFQNGKKNKVWPGTYDPQDRRSIDELIDNYRQLSETIIVLAKVYRFYLAPMDLDTRMRKRIEAALANCLYKQDGTVGAFQDKGIRYEPKLPTERPIKLVVEFPESIIGAPPDLLV